MRSGVYYRAYCRAYCWEGCVPYGGDGECVEDIDEREDEAARPQCCQLRGARKLTEGVRKVSGDWERTPSRVLGLDKN